MDKHKLISTEPTFVQGALVSHLKKLEDNNQDEQERSATNELLNKANRKRFRVYHAIFHERLRSSLLNLYVSKEKRSQLDAQNTVAAPPSFFEQASQLYNDPSWVPHTWLFPNFDSRLRTSIRLPLEKVDDSYETLTPENIKGHLTDARAAFKKVYARWKTSGNGSGNNKQKIRIIGTTYQDDRYDDEEEFVSVEDNRANFCHSVGVHIGYFWCVSEMFCVNQFMTQDCTGIGLTSSSGYISLQDRVKNRQNI